MGARLAETELESYCATYCETDWEPNWDGRVIGRLIGATFQANSASQQSALQPKHCTNSSISSSSAAATSAATGAGHQEQQQQQHQDTAAAEGSAAEITSSGITRQQEKKHQQHLQPPFKDTRIARTSQAVTSHVSLSLSAMESTPDTPVRIQSSDMQGNIIYTPPSWPQWFPHRYWLVNFHHFRYISGL